MTDALITVVVMTRDRPNALARSLPHHEAPVIVVDNASVEPAAAVVARARPDATCLRLACNAGAAARNVGVAAASTAYVAFADDDSWWAPGALQRAVEMLPAYPRTAVLTGQVQVGKTRRLDTISEAMRAAPFGCDADLPGPNVTGFLACAAVVRRDAFLAAGGFDPLLFFGGEEERLSLDLLTAGWGLAYVDDVVVRHDPEPRGDSAGRQALLARNAVLTAWMRRPYSVAAGRMLRLMFEGAPERAGVRASVRLLPTALARRRRVPPHVERSLRQPQSAGPSASIRGSDRTPPEQAVVS